jgi:glycosyltransferase involved in cell wall biosynthesis
MQSAAREQQQPPFVTVIMPVRNEADFVERSIGSVLRQDYPADRMEVLVADGMSDDGTREAVARLRAGDARLRLLDNPGRIVPTGMNVALERARGDIVVRVDGHCEIAVDYVSTCVRLLTQGRAECVGGPIQTIGTTYTACAIAAAMSSAFGVGGSAFRTRMDSEMLSDTVPFPAYTRSVIERIGPYDEELVRNQDDEFNYRLRALGGRVLLSPEIRSRYFARGTVRSLWKQYFQYGYWKVRVVQKHSRQVQLRQFVPLCFVLALVLCGAYAVFSDVGKALLAVIAGAYVVANVAASIATARRAGWRYLALLPVVYSVLHVSYGLGFAKGLLAFRRRWRGGGDRAVGAMGTGEERA